MTKKELILDCLIDDDEAKTQIAEFLKLNNVTYTDSELVSLLDEMIVDGLISINYKWKNENNEYPYSLTKFGREIWNNIIENNVSIK